MGGEVLRSVSIIENQMFKCDDETIDINHKVGQGEYKGHINRVIRGT